MPQSNVEIARRGYQAIARGDFDAVYDLLDPEVKWHGGDPSSGCRNRAEAMAFMRRPNRPQGARELVEIVDAGEQVVVIMRSQPDAGADPELHANVTTFREGKVIEMVHYENPDDALTAAGVRD